MPSASPKQPGHHRIIKKFAYLLSARWTRNALETVFLIYLARHSTTTFGDFTVALGLGSILLSVSEFGLNLPLVPLLARKDREPGVALGQVTLLKGLLLTLATVGALIFIELQDYTPALRQVMLLIALAVALETLSNTFFVALQVQGRQIMQGQVNVLAGVLGFGYGFGALVLGAPPVAVAAFKLIETLVNLAGGLWLVLAQRQFRPQWPSLGRLWRTLRLGAIFGLMEVTTIIYNKANLFFLRRYAGADVVAQYGVAWNMVDSISALVCGLLLQSILYPVFVKLWESDRDQVPQLAQNTARWLMAAALVAMFILFIESDRIILLLYGRHYLQAVWLQKVLVVTLAIAFLHNLAAFLMMSMGLPRLLLIFFLAGLVVNLLWCSLVMPWSPLLGAALAMVVTRSVVAALTVGFCQWRLGLIPKKPLLHLVMAALAGVLLYLAAAGRLPRELAEALALAPILALSFHWWRSER